MNIAHNQHLAWLHPQETKAFDDILDHIIEQIARRIGPALQGASTMAQGDTPLGRKNMGWGLAHCPALPPRRRQSKPLAQFADATTNGLWP